MVLMNTDIPVLWFDAEDYTIRILNEQMLPYQLKLAIKDTENCKTIPECAKNFDKVRQFFADRTLSLSRDNAKQLLQSVGNSQKLNDEERMNLSLKCRGISVTDNFWIKEDDENICFSEVNIRNKHLSDIIFQISIKGTPVSLEHSILAADITNKGMFRKTWLRIGEELYLCKSDRTSDKINTKSEIRASDLLEEVGANHVKYSEYVRDGEFCCICPCFVNDKISFVEAEYIKAFLERSGYNFTDYIRNRFRTEFANMVTADYCLCNPDEHITDYSHGQARGVLTTKFSL